MENQSRLEEKPQTKETIKFFVKLWLLIDMGVIIIVYFSTAPHFDVIASIMFIVGVNFLFSPLLLFVAFCAYFVHLTKLANIPKDTTLYECITSPTLQYGPLKVIIPVIREELVVNQIELSENQID